MWMDLSVTNRQTGVAVASANLLLDFSSNTWAVQANQDWGRLGIASDGYLEKKGGGALVLGNRVIQNKDNVIVLSNGPMLDPDPARQKGSGTLQDPFNSNYKGAPVNWRVVELTPVRERIKQICRNILLPTPDKFLTPGTSPMTRITTQTYATGGVTNCGVFPGWIAEQLGVTSLVGERIQFPKYQMATGEWVTPTPVGVTSPMTAWEDFVVRLEAMRGVRQGTFWNVYDPNRPARRPRPGDIYLLAKTPGGKFAHVGIVIESHTDVWITADSGQGEKSTEMIQVDDPKDKTKKITRPKWSSGMAAGYRRRQFSAADGCMTGEFNAKGYLKGWVNIDALYSGWTESMAKPMDYKQGS